MDQSCRRPDSRLGDEWTSKQGHKWQLTAWTQGSTNKGDLKNKKPFTQDIENEHNCITAYGSACWGIGEGKDMSVL